MTGIRRGVARRFGLPTTLAVGLLTWVGAGAASGQGSPIRMRTLTASDGLSSGIVTAVLRDRTGFIWVGTQAGLNRYDGHEFVLFTHDGANAASLTDNHVRVVLEDSAGALWVGTAGGGLNRLDRRTGEFERISLDPEGVFSGSDWVESLLEDHLGRLWVGTIGGGVMWLDPTSGEVRRFGSGSDGELSDLMVNVVYRDQADRIWVGTDKGLNLWDPEANRFDVFRHDPEDRFTLPHDRVLAIQEDSTGVLWVGTESGLAAFDPGRSEFERVPQHGEVGSLSHPHVTALIAGPPGTLWVGTFGGGLNELATHQRRVGSVQRAGPLSGLEDDRIRRMAVGTGSSFWIGTWGEGLTRVSTPAMTFGLIRHDPDDPTSLAPGSASGVAFDTKGRLWVASFLNGVSRRDAGSDAFVHYRHDPTDSTSLSGDDATRLLVASTGQVWVGTWASGLNRLNAETGHVDRYPPDPDRTTSLIASRVTALLEDEAGIVWVGTSNGLARLDDPVPPGRFTQVPGLAGDYVQALLQDSLGVIWAGTAGRGLVRLDAETLVHERFRHDLDDTNSISHDQVTALYESGVGILWVGTSGAGLNRVERRAEDGTIRFHTYLTSDGLINNSISSITGDGARTLWVATPDGLSVLTRDVRDNTTFDEANGLPVAEFSIGSQANSNEHHYFGTPAGVIVAPRGGPMPAHVEVPVTITSARALNSGMSLSADGMESVELPFGEVVLAEFAALDYEGRGDGAYEVLLEGLDDDWVDLGSTREVAFTNLSPGDYTLRVRGRTRHGEWSEAASALNFSIVPPLWMTAWFRLLVAGLIAGTLLLANQGRLRMSARREEAVKAKEDQFLALMERSHDLVSMLDERGRVLYLGPSVHRILGYEEGTRIGRDTRELIHPDDLEMVDQWIQGLFKELTTARAAAIRVRAADGSWRVLESVGTAFETKDGKQAIVNARDVTDRVEAEARTRQLEQALNQRQKLEAIGTLAGGVAHDFNNLLTVIGGHATLLQEDAGNREATLESAKEIRRAQESGAALTRQLLAFARKQRVARTALDLNDVLRGLDGMVRRLMGAPFHLDIQLSADHPQVMADAVQLEQVLINLVVNARDAMPAGGRVEVRTANRWIQEGPLAESEVPAGNWVVLEVSDQGVGIDEETLPHIFEPFFTTKQREKGTGLGLSTVYGIITSFGGHVTVRTARGKGTTFTVFLPHSEAEGSAVDEAVPEPVPENDRSETVLVAEDDDDVRRLVVSILRKEGYRVLEARDGVDALRIVDSGGPVPDLLLTDMVMPNMNGAELARRVRERWTDVRVLFMTGFANGSINRDSFDTSWEVLQKPFSPTRLSVLVRAALKGSHLRNPYRGWTRDAEVGAE